MPFSKGSRAAVRSLLQHMRHRTAGWSWTDLWEALLATGFIKEHIQGSTEHAESLGITLAEDILSRGAKEILDEVYGRFSAPVDGEISS